MLHLLKYNGMVILIDAIGARAEQDDLLVYHVADAQQPLQDGAYVH